MASEQRPTPRPSEAACATCRFWKDYGSGAFGQCRRNTPVVARELNPADPMEAVWPDSAAEDWCGEWTPGGDPEET